MCRFAKSCLKELLAYLEENDREEENVKAKGCLQKKNFIWKEKFLSGGEGVRKKGQISLVKEQKK